MDAATPRPQAAGIPALLAGLQSGLVGAFSMLLWLGIAAVWQQRNFWIPVNLMASVFYGPNAIRSGFAAETVSGLAVYIAIYSVLGALLALVLRDRLPRLRTFLVAVVFAVAWYYLSFRLLWKALMPYVALLHVERSTAIGHVIYGAVLGGYPAHLPKAEVRTMEPPADTPGETAS
jgi:hypothetical protein